MLEEMSYFPHYLQVTLLEINYKGKKKTLKIWSSHGR